MSDALTFGGWLKRRRMGLGLTQKELARRVGYAAVTLRKVEADELRPSAQMATKLAAALELMPVEQAEFVRYARDEVPWSDADLPVHTAPPVPRARPPESIANSKRGMALVPRQILPPQFTSFVGRQQELADLARLLADPACRLVTVIGQGGIGKTRIAVELAQRLLAQEQVGAGAYPHGVWFVDLHTIDSPERLVSAIADALELPPPGAGDARAAHLLACLNDRGMLLMLDCFEHLCEWAELLPAILTAAPHVKLLVTSRVALNLVQEWRYPLDGLPVAAHAAGEVAPSGAEGLFVERALHVLPAFDYPAVWESVQRICRLVEGIPLAIELAATWTTVLSCKLIADEIAHNLAFLTTAVRNVPEQHRSMRAVCARSWELLSPDERDVLARLSVFEGGFQRHAAAAVADATVPILAALLDKSLLRHEPGDCYRMHDLLRQYAAERLEQLGGAAAAAHACHSTYYAGFLDQRTEDMNGRRQRLALAEIAVEIENIRAAWQYAMQQGRIADIQRAVYPHYLFYDYRSRYREGAELLEQAIRLFDTLADPPAGTPTPTPTAAPPAVSGGHTEHGPGLEPPIQPFQTLAELLVCLGWLSIRLGDLQQARAALERSSSVLTRLAIPPRPGPGTDPLVALGTLANVLGDYPQAARLGEEARRRSEAHHDLGNLMYACHVLSNAAAARGRYAEAGRWGTQACQLANQLQDRWFMAYLVADLGDIARMTGDYGEALRQYQLGYTIREEYGDPEGIAVALVRLGQMSLLAADLPRAQAQFRQSLGIYVEISDRGGEATARQGLGMAALAAADYAAAAEHLHAALRLAHAIGYTSRTNSILATVAELFLYLGEPLRGAALLVSILRDPAGDRETCDRARGLLSRCTGKLTPAEVAAVSRGQQAIDLPALLAALQAAGASGDLLRKPGAGDAPLSGPEPTATPKAHAGEAGRELLVEPLTARELSVLHLIAAGHSNQEIAAELVITLGTAKWYVSQVLGKLGAHSRTQAVARGRKLGLLA